MTRIPDEDLLPFRTIFDTLQDNIDEARDIGLANSATLQASAAQAVQAEAVAADAKVLAQRAVDTAASAVTVAEGIEAVAETAVETAGNALDTATEARDLVGAVRINLAAVRDALVTVDSNSLARDQAFDARLVVMETRPGAAGGFGPNFVVSTTSPTELQRAVLASGGYLCTVQNAGQQIQAALVKYGRVEVVQGDYTLTTPLAPPARRSLVGWDAATNLIEGEGLVGQMISVTTDHVRLSSFAMSGLSGTTKNGTVHHVVVNGASKTGFWTGSEQCVKIDNLISRNARGDCLQMLGSFNRDGKIFGCHFYNPSGHGALIACPDGMISLTTVGSPSGHGFYFTKDSANWEISKIKAWYAELDGVYSDGSRNQYDGVQVQDCRRAGFRALGGPENKLASLNADSNSWVTGGANRGLHSGLEIGLNPAVAATTWAPGSRNPGGNDWEFDDIGATDKKEGGDTRGYNQRYGVLVGGGVTGMVLSNVHTGRAGGSHRNLTDGIFFVSPADRTNGRNSYSNLRSHDVEI